MKIAIQKSQKGWYIPPMNGKYKKPEIRYYEANSIKEAKHMHIMEHGFEWNYTVTVPVYEVGDYIGDCNNICYRITDIKEDDMTIERVCDATKENVFIDYERFYMLRQKGHSDIEEYPINSQWELLTKQNLFGKPVHTIRIKDYAISSGVFWAVDPNRNYIKFIVEKDELGKRIL